MPDAHANFAYSTVATAPSPATTGTSLTVASGDGAKFPAPPFNATVWPASAQPLKSNAEIVRVTAIATDTLTITRTQESTTARSIGVGDQIAATITAKTVTDAESGAKHGAKAVMTANYSLANNSQTALGLDTNTFDTDGYHSTVTNTTRITIPTGLDGVYLVLGMLRVAGGGSGQRSAALKKNGTSIGDDLVSAQSNDTTILVYSVEQLLVGDYIELCAWQNSGGNLNVLGQASPILTSLSVILLGR